MSNSNTIIRQLQIVFSISIILLIISLVASFYSTQKLIDNSKLVNHTNEVLLEAENIISSMKDAETGQRGYLVTGDELFLEPYNGAKAKVDASFNHLRELTVDNQPQQKNLNDVRFLYREKFAQMQRVIDLTNKDRKVLRDTFMRYQEMVRGKKFMDDLRLVINLIKKKENKLLAERTAEQSTYITYTPILILIASLISILITGFAYFKIKRDLDERIAKQKQAEALYRETAQRISQMEDVTREIAEGDYAVRSSDTKDDELGRVAKALNIMASSLEETFEDLKTKNWLQTGAVAMSNSIRGERELRRLSKNLIETLTSYSGALMGTVYIQDKDFNFRLTGSFAASDAPEEIIAGQGLAGQVLENKKTLVVTEIPENYIRISSSLGNTRPTCIVILPLVYSDESIGVIELGLLKTPTETELEFLNVNLEALSIGINSALDYLKLQNFLEETQAQSEELQSQHNELENLNAELEAQSQKLQASEEELRVQQEELQQTNGELEERSSLLEEKNIEIQRKAEELEISTRYKSEFLANMSHELRTPLNSILLLSRLLSENNEKNLSGDQVEYAKVIQSSGNGLLGLIDEILDLSKIEAGKMSLDFTEVSIAEITSDLNSLFNPVAKEKKLEFKVQIDPQVAPQFRTDKMRLEQILKNLISNALKFTAEGSVKLSIEKDKVRDNRICFSVKDTGIGIPQEKQHLIFEAFQQADGSTKRKYGGTGLGLSISRELVKLLGGELTLQSKPGEGSEFKLFLPENIENADLQEQTVSKEPEPKPEAAPADTRYLSTVIPENIPDDRDGITDADKTILIVEDDTHFAKSLLEYTRQKGYKGVVSVRGDEGLSLALAFKPLGILLDIQLPVKSGWEVMDELKANPETRHIPVHIMSSHRLKNESLIKGAIDFIDKPLAFDRMKDIFERIEHVVNKESRQVLILEDNSKHAKALAYFLETFNINSELKSDLNDGLETLKRKDVDCVILDMGIPDAMAYDMLEEAKKNPEFENLPIIIFTGKSLSMAEELKIKKYADSIVVKTAHSYQRMLDEISLFLHLVEENKKDENPKNSHKKLGALTEILHNKTVLIADDDVRNIFSLTKALENYKMNVVTALDGKEALEKLESNKEIDVVLLDMMMPQMDGYETAQRIRENPEWKNLPVIAVTAKAMTGDREKCINAGASDYITKPVDIDQLISLLRVWLYEK